jgi:hypothetical protein
MKFTYSITLTDYQNAQRLAWHRTLLRRIIYYSNYWLIPVLISTLAIVFFSRLGIFGLFFEHSPIIYAFAFGFVVSVVINTILSPHQSVKRYRELFDKNFPPDKRASWCIIDDDGILSATIGSDEVKRPWQEVVHFAQNDKITLLFLSKKKFYFIPTNALSMEQRVELLGYVDRYVRKEK